jgi:hypothetical protein
MRQAVFEKYFILRAYFRIKVHSYAKNRSTIHLFAIYFIAVQAINMRATSTNST